MKISIITAMTKEFVIGKGNKLPWNIPDELQYFKSKTLNKAIIMGGNTFVSINKKPLPYRYNIVLTKNPDQYIYNNNYNNQKISTENLSFTTNIKDSLLIANNFYDNLNQSCANNYSDQQKEVMVIGGREIYQQYLPLANKLYISIIKNNYPGDILFPEYDKFLWYKVCSEEYAEFIAEIWERL
jgi:dihydrofolate reductase